jgi:flagellar biosynthesis protein FlhG
LLILNQALALSTNLRLTIYDLRLTTYDLRLMVDQAFTLRRLIESGSPHAVDMRTFGPRLVVVTGCKSGVGATTVAVNLAAVLADRGKRVVLVDAAQQAPNLAQVAGAGRAVEKSLADVLAGSCSVAEALAPGPCGCLLLTNGRAASANVDYSRQAQRRLLEEMQSLRSAADVLVVDAGSGLTPWTRRFWMRAAVVLLVTTTDDRAVLDAYTLVKRCTADRIESSIRVLVNQSESDSRAQEACRRLSQACQRFLSRAVPSVPSLPRWQDDGSSRGGAYPRVWEAPNTAFGHGVMWLEKAISELVALSNADSAGAGDGPARARSRVCA